LHKHKKRARDCEGPRIKIKANIHVR